MDRDVINAKLESMARCIKRIEERCPPSAKALAADIDAQDIIVLNLERAVQLSVDVGSMLLKARNEKTPDSMAEVFLVLVTSRTIKSDLAGRLANAVRFRNLAVHEYVALNWKIVHSIATSRMDDFRLFAKAVLRATSLTGKVKKPRAKPPSR